jgi:hypothetical protein
MVHEGATAGPAVFDPFRYRVELPWRADLYPLGFALELTTNSREVLQAAREGWEGFPRMFPEAALQVRVAVAEDNPAPCPTGLVFRAQRNLLAMISDEANFAMCDLRDRFAFCWISAETARRRDWFRYYYLDTIIQLILWHSHLTRVHASCVARNGRGVLLCGPSGAGKSCLAYACARRGWTFISDEACSLLRRTGERVVLGKPHQIHFRDTAVRVLPELDGRLAARNPVGKMTIELHTAELPGITTGYRCRAQALVFLNRQTEGAARLLPFSREEAWRRLEQDLPVFAQPAHDEHKASLRNLIEAGVYELRYSGLNDAVEELDSLAAQGGTGEGTDGDLLASDSWDGGARAGGVQHAAG